MLRRMENKMDIAIKLNDISKSFELVGRPNVDVLNNVSLDIFCGEMVAITGRSGSGKSTLLHIMSGLMKPTTGTAIINGADISAFDNKEIACFRNREMGFVFQSFFLEPALSAWENVSLPLVVRKTTKRDRKKLAMETLDKVGLGHRFDHKPGELSGGEIQRVCIARALVGNPKIIFADEPTGNLDTESGRNIMATLKGLVSDDITVVLVTHNQEDAYNCNRIIQLSDGIIIP